MNIFEYAMKMELEGKAFYEKLAAETELSGLANIFTTLAVDEQKHYDIFKALQEQTQKTEMTDSKALEGAKNIFADLQQQGFSEKLKNNLTAYQYAMRIEVESAKLYQDAAEKEDNQEVKNLLLRIALEERKHYVILENIFEFVNAPNQSLVWGEFSNLDEF